MLHIIWSIIVGFVVGWIAGKFMGMHFGFWITAIVGIGGYQAVPVAREGHRQRGRTSRAVDAPDRRIDRTLEKPRQGPFVTPRPPQNGGPAPEFARLFEPVRSRTL